MNYEILLSDKAIDFLKAFDSKSERICKNNLAKLSYPGRRMGDKEKLGVLGEKIYRMHISRRFTAFLHN